MINTFVRNRGTGKTTEIIVRLKENEGLIAIVHGEIARAIYPEEVQDRVFTINQLMSDRLRGIEYERVIIDEGFLLSKDRLAKLYYSLGSQGIKIDVYGSIETA